MVGNETKIDGVYYLIVPDDEVEKVHGCLKRLGYNVKLSEICSDVWLFCYFLLIKCHSVAVRRKVTVFNN